MARKRRKAGPGARTFETSARGRQEQSLRGPAAVVAQAAPTKDTAVTELDALVLHYWFDSGTRGEPYSATLELRGRRRGITGKPTPEDTFQKEESFDGIVPGTGQVSVTSWVYGLTPGEWDVEAELIRPAHVTSQSGLTERRAAVPPSRSSPHPGRGADGPSSRMYRAQSARVGRPSRRWRACPLSNRGSGLRSGPSGSSWRSRSSCSSWALVASTPFAHWESISLSSRAVLSRRNSGTGLYTQVLGERGYKAGQSTALSLSVRSWALLPSRCLGFRLDHFSTPAHLGFFSASRSAVSGAS